LGCHVYLAGRSLEKLEAAKLEIAAVVKDAKLTVLKQTLDLSSYESIVLYVQAFLNEDVALNYLVNNAGLFTGYAKTKNGLDMVAGTNWFGGYALTRLLLDKLKASAPSRIINVSSNAHRAGSVLDVQTVLRPTSSQFSAARAYANSKLLNILHSLSLARQLAGTGVTSYSMHPGMVYTGISSGLGNWASVLCGLICCWGSCPCIRDVSQGASTVIYLCIAPASNLENGKYYIDCKPAHISAHGDDIKLAEKWDEEGLMLMKDLSASSPSVLKTNLENRTGGQNSAHSEALENKEDSSDKKDN